MDEQANASGGSRMKTSPGMSSTNSASETLSHRATADGMAQLKAGTARENELREERDDAMKAYGLLRQKYKALKDQVKAHRAGSTEGGNDDIARVKAEAELNAEALERSVAERDQKIEKMKRKLDRAKERALAKAEANNALNKELKFLQTELKRLKRMEGSEGENAQNQLAATAASKQLTIVDGSVRPAAETTPLLGTSRSTRALTATGGSSGSLLPPTIVEETEPAQAAAEAAAVAKRQTGQFSDDPRQPRRVSVLRDVKKASIPARTFIDRPAREVIKLRSSENAWKRGAVVSGLEKKLRTVRSLMNKITPNTADSLIKQFLDFKVSTDEILVEEVVEIICDKAAGEPEFARLYAMLCKAQVEDDLKSSSDGTHSPFRDCIMRYLQKAFKKKDDESLEALRKRVREEQDAQKKHELEIEEQELYQRLRRIKFGSINFIGQLYLLHQLPSRVIGHCVQELFKLVSIRGNDSCDDEAVLCVVKLLDVVGASVQQNPDDLGPDWLKSYLNVLESMQTKVTLRVRVMIMNLLDLANDDWHRRATQEQQSPKKLEEIFGQRKKGKKARKMAKIANCVPRSTGIDPYQAFGKKRTAVSVEGSWRVAAKASNTTGSA